MEETKSDGNRKQSESGAEFFDKLSAMQPIESATGESKPETKNADPLQEFDKYSDSFLSLIKEEPKKKENPEIPPVIPIPQNQASPPQIQKVPAKIEESKITLVKPIARKFAPPISPVPLPQKVEEQKSEIITPAPIKPSEEVKALPEIVKKQCGLAISNKGTIIFGNFENANIGIVKIGGFEKELNELSVQMHKLIFTGAVNTKEGDVKIVEMIRKLIENTKEIKAAEKLVWDLIIQVMQYKSLDIFNVAPEYDIIRAGIIKMLEDFSILQQQQPISSEIQKSTLKITELSAPKEAATEKTLLEMAHNGNWMEAVMLSRYINPLMYGKLTELYLETHANGNPVYTLLLLNQSDPEKIFALNPNLAGNWASHIAFLLKNIEICSQKGLREFIEILQINIKNENYAEYLFLQLLAGMPILSLEEFYTGIGKSLRHFILAELITVLWANYGKNMNGGEIVKSRLVSIYYGKALAFTELGYTSNALESLKQVNALKILGKGWIIYSKLLDLTELLQNKIIRHEKSPNHSQLSNSKPGIISSIASGISGLFVGKSAPAQKISKPATQPKVQSPQFYYDNGKKKWIINGKEANVEFDMGQEPIQKAGNEILPPPPVVSKPVPVQKQVGKEEAKKIEKIADPFGYKLPQKPEVEKSAIHQPKYVNKP